MELVFLRVAEVVDKDYVWHLEVHLANFDVNHSQECLLQLPLTSVLIEPKAMKITLNANGQRDPSDLLHHVEVGDVPLNLTNNLKLQKYCNNDKVDLKF